MIDIDQTMSDIERCLGERRPMIAARLINRAIEDGARVILWRQEREDAPFALPASQARGSFGRLALACADHGWLPYRPERDRIELTRAEVEQ